MYCANCGVKLADTEKVCPLCGVRAYHPDLTRNEVKPLYATQHSNTNYQVSSKAAHIVLTAAFLLAAVISLLIDWQISSQIIWSGYVSGAIILSYIILVLPTWFTKPNPIIFLSCDFLAIGLYLLYINLAAGGNWFLSFAFPVTGVIAAVMITVTALLRYVRRGRLYIIGGASIFLGLFMPITELLVTITFDTRFIGWCIYPALVLVVLGGMLIFLAINHHAREAMEKKFFI